MSSASGIGVVLGYELARAAGARASATRASTFLERARQQGLDLQIWHVSGSDTNNYPFRKGLFGKILDREFRSPDESARAYISRLAKSGVIRRIPEGLQIIDGRVTFGFAIKSESVIEAMRPVRVYSQAPDSIELFVEGEDVFAHHEGESYASGPVSVRYHDLALELQGWSNTPEELRLLFEHLDRFDNRPHRIFYD